MANAHANAARVAVAVGIRVDMATPFRALERIFDEGLGALDESIEERLVLFEVAAHEFAGEVRLAAEVVEEAAFGYVGVGHNLIELDFQKRSGLRVIGIRRDGKAREERVVDTVLESGDLLLTLSDFKAHHVIAGLARWRVERETG